ncbi:hypothetical protein K461DRAFT_324137 [Myriangium duriaei CBS 260.36]|uniref:Zn(2)-C6 fungal-type domain-containing protein n=1 Tax=Myriangium duriaei CBS 260.36 TaxID=1168546 RepID=A0A9P4ITF7_9PEZI|nr:hypothetical protein K461DRAFT_324137 [Myriangium duriaei CBS 260.36]
MPPLPNAGRRVAFHVLGNQSRRFACDRCRDQKLRCVYQDPQSNACERCQRTKSDCTYDVPSACGRAKKSDDVRQEVNGSNQSMCGSDTVTGASDNNTPAGVTPAYNWLTNLDTEDTSFFDFDDLSLPIPQPDPPNLSQHSLNDLHDIVDLPVSTVSSTGDQSHTTLPPVEVDARPTQEESLQRLYDLDMRLFKLSLSLGALRTGLRAGSCSDGCHNGPIREVLAASQSFVNLLTTTTPTSHTSDSPGFLLISVIHVRLLGVYTELMSFLSSDLNLAYSLSPTMVSEPGQHNPLISGLGLQLAGLDAHGHDNLVLRLLVETCTYMLDKINRILGTSASPSQANAAAGHHGFGYTQQEARRHSFGGLDCVRKPTVLDVVAIAVRYDGLMSQESGKAPISSLESSIRQLNELLRMG